MKIDGEVVSVSTQGDRLVVRVQGLPRGASDWHPYLTEILEVPETETTRAAYYVGRRIAITVRPA